MVEKCCGHCPGKGALITERVVREKEERERKQEKKGNESTYRELHKKTILQQLMRKKERVTIPPVFYKQWNTKFEVWEVCNMPGLHLGT